MPAHRPLEARFWSKVNKDGPVPTGHPSYEGLGPCWLFSGGMSIALPFAHRLAAERKPVRVVASRYSYELHSGEPIPPGLLVRHKCDNGHLFCVNPAHLVLGTQAQNTADRYERRVRPAAYLTPAQVDMARSIWERYGTPVEDLAVLAGVMTGSMKKALYEPRCGTGLPTAARRRAPDFTPEELAEIRAAIEAGATLRKAAGFRDWASVAAALSRAGFDYEAFEAARKEQRRAESIRLYRAGYSALGIAKKLGVSQPTVRALLQDAGLYEGRARQGPRPPPQVPAA